MRKCYSSLGCGFRFRNFETSITNLIGEGHLIRTRFKQPLYKGLFLRAETSSLLNSAETSNIFDAELALDYHISAVKASLVSSYYNPHSLRVQFELKTSFGKVSICNEYLQEQNVIYLGFRRHNCRFSVPVAATNSVAVAVIFGVAYLMGWILRKDKKQDKTPKLESTRIEELRLIEERASDNYRKEVKDKGLIIEYAYYGDAKAINEMSVSFESFSRAKVPMVPREAIN